jgi:hypothetical protein
MARPAIRTIHPSRAVGVLLIVLSVATFVGVIVHVTGETGLPADEHLPTLLIALLGAVVAFAAGLALLLPRPPAGN